MPDQPPHVPAAALAATGFPALELQTPDGGPVSLARLGAPATVAGAAHPTRPDRAWPVLLLPGIGSNRAVFLDGPSFGLGAALWRRGFDCWLGQFRYAERERRPGWRWNFTDLMGQDVPVMVEAVRQRTGERPILLGYSLGGMLAVAALARGLTTARGLILVGSPVHFTQVPLYPALMRACERWLRWTGLRRAPVRVAARGVAIGFWGLQTIESGRPSAAVRRFCGLVRRAAADVSRPLLTQTLTWLDAGRFSAEPGADDERRLLPRIALPTLVIAGSRDRIAPTATVRPAFEAIGHPVRGWIEADGLGHIELAHGPAVPALAGRIAAWLERPEVATALAHG